MIYGYARVSTKQQNLELQLNSLKKYGCDKIFAEKVTGDYRKRKDREQLDELLSVIKSGDTLVVWKLDRLSRTLLQTVSILEHLLKNDISFVSISDNFDTTTSYGKALLYMAAVFAQLEVDLISERTIEGLEAARQNGRYGGRPAISKTIQSKMYQMYYSGDYTINEICSVCDITQTTLYNYLKRFNENPEERPELVSFDKPPRKEKISTLRNAGRPTLHETLVEKVQTMYADPRYSVSDIVKTTGLSRSTIYKYGKQKKERNDESG